MRLMTNQRAKFLENGLKREASLPDVFEGSAQNIINTPTSFGNCILKKKR
jgi:hypothetical protein